MNLYDELAGNYPLHIFKGRQVDFGTHIDPRPKADRSRAIQDRAHYLLGLGWGRKAIAAHLGVTSGHVNKLHRMRARRAKGG